MATQRPQETSHAAVGTDNGPSPSTAWYSVWLLLNIHFHMLFVDGVYVEARDRLRFRRVKAPERAELEALVHTVSERVGRHLERQGLLVRDAENGYLALEPEGEDALAPVLGSSIAPTGSRSARTRGARPSPCAPWRPSAGQTSRARGWPRRPASPCTPGCWPRPGSGGSSGSAATLRARRWRPSGSRSPPRARCATS